MTGSLGFCRTLRVDNETRIGVNTLSSMDTPLSKSEFAYNATKFFEPQFVVWSSYRVAINFWTFIEDLIGLLEDGIFPSIRYSMTISARKQRNDCVSLWLVILGHLVTLSAVDSDTFFSLGYLILCNPRDVIACVVGLAPECNPQDVDALVPHQAAGARFLRTFRDGLSSLPC